MNKKLKELIEYIKFYFIEIVFFEKIEDQETFLKIYLFKATIRIEIFVFYYFKAGNIFSLFQIGVLNKCNKK